MSMERSQNEFWSVDSAPKKFAGQVEQSRAPKVLVLFSILSLIALYSVNEFAFSDAFFPNDDLMLVEYAGNHGIPLRIYLFCFFISFAAFCEKEFKKKIRFGLDMVLTFGVLCALMDMCALLLREWADVLISVHAAEIASGIIGFAVYSYKLLENGSMPARIGMHINPGDLAYTTRRLIFVSIFAAAVSLWVSSQEFQTIEVLRSFSLLGGIGPGVFLFLPVLFCTFYIIGRSDLARASIGRFAPDVTLIIPAHNEEYIIENTLNAVDVAAGNYAGGVRVLVMNNNSEDATEEIAKRTLAQFKHARGEVVNEYKAGKSHALNAGLAAARTDYLVRVDADTLIDPMALKLAMRHFRDPNVAVVGGVPVPPFGAMFDRARYLEVVVKHGFYSVAMGAINGVVGVPGMLAIYQTELPRRLGGFVEGMNGEDTDISLRIGSLGYRLVVDPKVKYISEVPASYGHMREQRMRWFRSIYHISARCRDLLYGKHLTLRGKLILPYMLINSGRRAMMVPLLLFGIIEYMTGFNTGAHVKWQSVLALAVGAPTIVAAISSLLDGSVKGILYVPEYLIFRVLRAYFTLESMLSISIKDYSEHIYSDKALNRKRPASRRIA